MARVVSEIEKACMQGRSDEAEKLLAKTAGAGTETAEYQCHLGLVRESQGRYEEAIEAYERALQLEPPHRLTLFRLAYLYDLRGEENLAIDYYKQCTQQPPVHEGALLNLGVLFEDASRYDEAIDCFSRILKANPNHKRARLFLRDAQASRAMFYDEESDRRRDKRNQVLEIPVTDFELSVRSRNCLKQMHIRTLGDLLRTTEPELLAYKNFGETSLNEIKAMLTQKGLKLGQGLEQPPVEPPQPVVVTTFTRAAVTSDAPIHSRRPVAELELSVRSRKCLQRLGIATLGDLMQRSEVELLAIKNFGQTSLTEIKRQLALFGLTLRLTP